MACDQANQTATSTAGDSGNAVSAADNESREARIMMQIMKLMHAYQVFEGGSKQTDTTGLLSVSA